jgi:FtsP/CotA-like multicopper oxidase with cupredoxin domain
MSLSSGFIAAFLQRHLLIPLQDYPNSQNGRTLWYHDHAVALTAENSYFGQAGFYLIRDPEEQNMPGLPQGAYNHLTLNPPTRDHTVR